MTCGHPNEKEIPELRGLWQEAFGDEDEYLDVFFATAFAPDRCMRIRKDGRLLAALYWFDCSAYGQPLAYIFGVAVACCARGKGLCRRLLDQTCIHLTDRGVSYALLMPAKDELYPMYRKLGFVSFGSVCETVVLAAESDVPMRAIDGAEFAALRKGYLPDGGVLQDGANIAFLAARTQLYAGEDFVLAYFPDGNGFGVELLGNAEQAPRIARTLGKERLRVRTVGNGREFAMLRPLGRGGRPPEYFGLPFDF